MANLRTNKNAEILVDTEQAYQNPEKADNFALFFLRKDQGSDIQRATLPSLNSKIS